MRRIGVVTVGRSDYGGYRPVLRALAAAPDVAPVLIVGGAHLAAGHGDTIREIEADGFAIAERIDMLLATDTPAGVAASMGIGTLGFAGAYARQRPDLLLVLGDRFEMHAAVAAAVPFGIPVAHLHGGELTQGAMDDMFRHSITKLSHLHFVATEVYAARVRQMGEEPWRITVTGAPALDLLRMTTLMSGAALEAKLGVPFARPPLLVTYHPVTTEYERAAWQARELVGALADIDVPVLFTAPNADQGGRVVRSVIEEFVARRANAWLVESLGTEAYWSAMALAPAMVGNSSSGLVEAPSLGLPVVNVGTRQAGRVRAANVIDVGDDRGDIAAGIHKALARGFRESLAGLPNPYGAGRAAELIVATLRTVALDARLRVKRFVDVAPC